VYSVRSLIALSSGAWDRARHDLERATALDHEVGGSWASKYRLLLLGGFYLATGAWGEAAFHLEKSVALSQQGGDLTALRDAQSWLAERDLWEGRPDAALVRLRPLLDRPGLVEWSVTPLLVIVAWAYLEQGQVSRAWQMARQATRRARAYDQRRSLVDALRVQAMVAIRQRRAEAHGLLEEALVLARTMGYLRGEAHVLCVCGLLHEQHGEPGLSREHLEQALALFQRLGAHRDAERTEAAIERLAESDILDTLPAG
jgi:tetratricopeptide (TPR) repeat protein